GQRGLGCGQASLTGSNVFAAEAVLDQRQRRFGRRQAGRGLVARSACGIDSTLAAGARFEQGSLALEVAFRFRITRLRLIDGLLCPHNLLWALAAVKFVQFSL